VIAIVIVIVIVMLILCNNHHHLYSSQLSLIIHHHIYSIQYRYLFIIQLVLYIASIIATTMSSSVSSYNSIITITTLSIHTDITIACELPTYLPTILNISLIGVQSVGEVLNIGEKE
jgi:hypothetical protein